MKKTATTRLTRRKMQTIPSIPDDKLIPLIESVRSLHDRWGVDLIGGGPVFNSPEHKQFRAEEDQLIAAAGFTHDEFFVSVIRYSDAKWAFRRLCKELEPVYSRFGLTLYELDVIPKPLWEGETGTGLQFLCARAEVLKRYNTTAVQLYADFLRFGHPGES